jgi:predicted small lipoprotein YifL
MRFALAIAAATLLAACGVKGPLVAPAPAAGDAAPAAPTSPATVHLPTGAAR